MTAKKKAPAPALGSAAEAHITNHKIGVTTVSHKIPPKGSSNAGPCIACLAGTDTALAFEGSLEWITAGLVALGVPYVEAEATIRQYGPVIDAADRGVATFRVCSRCCREASLPAPAVTIPGAPIPCIHQPEGAR